MIGKEIAIILGLTVFLSCNMNHPSPCLNVDIDCRLEEGTSFFDWFQNVRAVPLDKDLIISNGKFSEPQYYDISDSTLYILDVRSNNTYSFDLNGKYKKTIAKRGRGAGEYTLAYAIRISQSGKCVKVLDPRGSIYSYSESFEGSEQIEGLRAVHNFIEVGKKTVLFSSAEEPYLWILEDGISRPVRYDSTFPLKGQFNAPDPFISCQDDRLYYFEAFSGNIFELDFENDCAEPVYSWDFGKHNSEVVDMSDSTIDFFDYLKGESFEKVFPFLNMVMAGDCIFANVLFHNEEYSLFYNLSTKESAFFKKFKEGIEMKVSLYKNGRLYAIIEPEFLDNYVNDSIFNNPEQLTFLKNWHNGILLEYTPK